VYLAPTLKDVDPLFRSDDRITIEISGSLFKFREILDALQGPLRTEQSLDVYSAERWGIQAMSEFLRSDIAYQMGGGIRMPV
jgi:hypothetical protein